MRGRRNLQTSGNEFDLPFNSDFVSAKGSLESALDAGISGLIASSRMRTVTPVGCLL